MPVYRSGRGNAPRWCALDDFQLLDFADAQPRGFDRVLPKEELIVCRGAVEVVFGGVVATLLQGGKMDFNGPVPARYEIRPLDDSALVFRGEGHWDTVTSSGVFTVKTEAPPPLDTPYAYHKTTSFDNHYHDGDEYWIVFEGRARVASEDRLYEVGPGDCVATGMGWHHDVVELIGEVQLRAVWFEGTLEGQKRVGHLWVPRHGKAVPCKERV